MAQPPELGLFFVIEGELVIELQDQQVRLGAGDLFTVPKGVVHRTRPVGARSVNLTFERREAGTVYVCRGCKDDGADGAAKA